MSLKKRNNYKYSTVDDCVLVDLSKIQNRAGNITILENQKDVPFDINRIYYLYDVPGGEERGGHGHYNLEQYLIAAGGSFEVELFDGIEKKSIFLNQPYIALHIVPGIWRELKNFSSGSICLVMASENYKEDDYIRDYKEFQSLKR